MFCGKCGHEVHDEAVICVNCGCQIPGREPKPATNPEHQTSKTGMGVLFALLLGLIGLIIGLFMYPENTVARKTFIKAWGITYGVTIGVVVLLYVIMFVVAFAFAGATY